MGAEVRARFARLSDGAGVELLEDDGRRVDFHARLFEDARRRACNDGARAEPSARLALHPQRASQRRARQPGRLYGHDLDGLSPVRRRLRLQLPDSFGDVRRGRARRHGRDRARTSITMSSKRARRRRCATKCSAVSKPTASCSCRSTVTSTRTKSTASVTRFSPTMRIFRACLPPHISATRRPDDRYYENTRRFLLSQDNPSFYQGHLARGIGSYHTPDHWVWPLALIIEGMTATTSSEKAGRARSAPRERSRRSSAARVVQPRQSAAVSRAATSAGRTRSSRSS